MMTGRRSLFDTICVLLTVCTLLIIGSVLLVIVLRGGRSISGSLSSPNTLFALSLSIRTAAVSTLLCLMLAIPAGYTLTHLLKRAGGVFEVLLELTLSLPNIVIGLSLLILFSSGPGSIFKSLGIPVIFSRNGIVAAQTVVNLPFAVKMTATAFREIDPRLEKISGLLGAGPAERFFRILLPLCRNSIISTLVLVWARALGEFGATLMLVGVTRMKTETLPAGIYLNVSVNDLSGALASAFLLLMLSAAAMGIAVYYSGKDRKKSRYV